MLAVTLVCFCASSLRAHLLYEVEWDEAVLGVAEESAVGLSETLERVEKEE